MRYFFFFLFGLLMTRPGTSFADDWGCQVMLCLSDPRGATTEKECVPPMKKLWRHLAQGKPFPTCDLVQATSYHKLLDHRSFATSK